MIVEYVIPKEFFNQLVEVNKTLKSTFIVIDKLMGIYGYIGEEYGNSNYLELGALTYINKGYPCNVDINNIPDEILTSIVLYSKDITSLSKISEDKPIYIAYNVFDNTYIPYSIYVKDGDNIIDFPVLIAYPFISKYQYILGNQVFNEEVDITETQKFAEIVNMKASQGGGLFTVLDKVFFGIANLFHMNKGDRAYISYSQSLVKFRIQKKKNISINIIYRYLNL